MRSFSLLTIFFVVALVVPTWAMSVQQGPVTTADISRLETTAADISRQVTNLRRSDPTLANDVDRTLSDLNDDITYLRVKLRREGAVTREEFDGVRDRLETLRVRAQGDRVAAQPTAAPDRPRASGVVPVGTELDIRLQGTLDSGTAKVEQRFDATTIADYPATGGVIVPAGSIVRGFVSSVRPASRIERKGQLTLSFDEIRIGNRSYRLRASVTEAMDAKSSEDVTRIGAGAAVGAIIGGILGGGKGALLGVLVGGGGTIAATEGSDVNLPAGTILRIRLDQALDVSAD